MSYGLPEQPRRRGGIGRLIFPAIIFFGALMFFRSMSAPPAGPDGPRSPAGQGGAAVDDQYQIKEDLFETDRSSVDDEYQIREGLFDRGQGVESNGKPMPTTQSQSGTSAQKGWSIEEVDGDKQTRSPQSNKTTKGQWSIEEVDDETSKAKPQFKFSDQ